MALNVGDKVRYKGSFFKAKLERRVGTVHSLVGDKLNTVVVEFPQGKEGNVQSFMIGEKLLVLET